MILIKRIPENYIMCNLTRALTATADSIPSLAQIYLRFLGGFYY
jgi:hypothetical protein